MRVFCLRSQFFGFIAAGRAAPQGSPLLAKVGGWSAGKKEQACSLYYPCRIDKRNRRPWDVRSGSATFMIMNLKIKNKNEACLPPLEHVAAALDHQQPLQVLNLRNALPPGAAMLFQSINQSINQSHSIVQSLNQTSKHRLASMGSLPKNDDSTTV